MYTGIIDHMGEIIGLSGHKDSIAATIQCNYSDLSLGESIAIDGICVTVKQFKENVFTCDFSPETLKITTAKYFKIGKKVNIERSLRLGDRLGGHFVMGHVDTTGTIKAIKKKDSSIEIRVGDLTESVMSYVIKKGSITVNGISLTINEVGENFFDLMIIPHTRLITNIQFLKSHDKVNIEFDTITRVIIAQSKSIQKFSESIE